MQTSPQDRGLVRREGSLISTDTHHPNIMVAFTGLYIKKSDLSFHYENFIDHASAPPVTALIPWLERGF